MQLLEVSYEIKEKNFLHFFWESIHYMTTAIRGQNAVL